MCRIISIPSLVWLRRTVRRWRSSAADGKQVMTDGGAAAVPAGYVAVRVEAGGGGSARRFVVRLAHLNHPAFRELLRQAEEEYGFPPASGPIALPCDEGHLRDVLRRVCVSSSGSEERSRLPGRSRSRPLSLSSCCGAAAAVTARRRGGDSRPLLQGMVVDKLVW